MSNCNQLFIRHKFYLRGIANGCAIHIDRGGSREGRRFAGLVDLGFRALREDGLKVLVVRPFVEAKGTDMDNELTEGSG